MRTPAATRALFWGLLAFFAFFFVLPILGSIKAAFTSASHGFTLSYIWEVFINDLFRTGLINSFVMAVGTTLGCLIVAVPLAMLYVKYDFPFKSVLNSLVLVPMVLPPFVGAIGIKAMLGQAGSVNSLLIGLHLMNPQHPVDWLGDGRLAGIIVMNVLHLYPILYLNVSAALANLDPALEEAAANLGCPPQHIFRRISLPLIMPGIFAGGTITFIWAFTELGVPLVFDFDRVTSVQIFNSLKDIAGNPIPYALVVVMLVITSVIYILSKRVFERGHEGTGGGRATTARTTVKPPPLIALGATLCFSGVTLMALLPHIGVVLLSVAKDWYQTVLPSPLTLSHYHDVLGHELTLGAIANSVKYSTLATFLDVALGLSVAWIVQRTTIKGRQILDAAAMLPLAVPGLVMAFGYLALSREGQPYHWLMIGENPVLIIVIAYSVRRLPYIVRAASAGLQQVSTSLEEAAQNLGADPTRAFWRITLPLVAPNLIAGGLLAFSFAMLEVSDSMILAQQAVHYPITKAIYSIISALGNGPNLAAALGVWAMCFLGVTMLGASMILGRKLGAMFRA